MQRTWLTCQGKGSHEKTVDSNYFRLPSLVLSGRKAVFSSVRPFLEGIRLGSPIVRPVLGDLALFGRPIGVQIHLRGFLNDLQHQLVPDFLPDLLFFSMADAHGPGAVLLRPHLQRHLPLPFRRSGRDQTHYRHGGHHLFLRHVAPEIGEGKFQEKMGL